VSAQPQPTSDVPPEVREAPYAKPLEAIDQVLRLDSGGITTAKLLSGDAPWCEGHYPGQPIFPGVFIIESVHQAVRRFLAATSARPRLLEVRTARFLSMLRPGDVLECDCRCTRVDEGAGLEVKARCRAGAVLAAEVTLVYRLRCPDA
jgi:3-hydroxyacyl-[acyl-carrier-protein] dehydratase